VRIPLSGGDVRHVSKQGDLHSRKPKMLHKEYWESLLKANEVRLETSGVEEKSPPANLARSASITWNIDSGSVALEHIHSIVCDLYSNQPFSSGLSTTFAFQPCVPIVRNGTRQTLNPALTTENQNVAVYG
jgi:hypothetical protein